MSDRELPLAQKASELLLYTRAKTKPVSSDADAKDVRALLHKIAALDDLEKVRKACADAAAAARCGNRKGFSKSAFRDFGQDMRQVSKEILLGVYAANNPAYRHDPQRRIDAIDDVLNRLSLLEKYIQICAAAGIISAKTAGEWTGKALDVKRIAAAWRGSTEARMGRKTE